MEIEVATPDTLVDTPVVISEEVKQKNELFVELKEQLKNIEKSVNQRDNRFMMRTLRFLLPLRKRLNREMLNDLIKFIYPGTNDDINMFLKTDNSQHLTTPTNETKKLKISNLPEVNVYVHLLVLLFLIDSKDNKKALDCANVMMEKLISLNRRTLDLLASKCYFYYARVYEINNIADQIRRLLFARLRTCTLRKDHDGVAVLTNLILRNFIIYKLYNLADTFASKTNFPETATNNEWARYYYYMGHIKAIHLEYSLAQKNLTLASRKGPQNLAIGFKQAINKLAIVVQLLLGEIPERNLFKDPALKKSLIPYFQLTQAVRLGDLDYFSTVLQNCESRFLVDSTFTLIIRLRQNVLKTGIKKINSAYSRISMIDIAKKLNLMKPSGSAASSVAAPQNSGVGDCEYILAKAIRDKVITQAYIVHDKNKTGSQHAILVNGKYAQDIADSTAKHGKKSLSSYTDMITGYGITGEGEEEEPSKIFHERIHFCLDIHERCVKSLRYPPKHKDSSENNENRREKEQMDMEIAKQLAETDEDDFF